MIGRTSEKQTLHRGWIGSLRWCVALLLCLLCIQCVEPTFPPCLVDADCSDGKVCVAAGCVPKPPSCSGGCVKHDDCSPCPTEQRFCSNGRCSAPPPICPSRCERDQACSPCGENKTKCIDNVCVRAPDCPNTCTSDLACAGCGDYVCFNQSCAPRAKECPAACHIDRDCTGCKEGFRACIGGICGAESAACENDQQCKDGKKCIWKECTSGTIVGQTCSGACPVGFICTGGHCFEDCSNDSSLCAKNTSDGRTYCVPISYSDQKQVSVCFGLANEGELCGVLSYNTPKQAFCRSGLFPPLFCNDEGVCQKAQIQRKEGDVCHKRGEPRKAGEPLKVCDQLSNVPLGCDNNLDKGKCVKAQKAKAGLPCDATGLALNVPTLCDNSSVCIPIYHPYIEGRCFETCTTDGAIRCAQNGFSCETYSLDTLQGVCLQTPCTQNSDCSFVGYECKPGFGGGKLCLPPIPSGTQAFGQVCGARACGQDFECLTTTNAGDGFCTKACQDQSSCPTATDKGTVYKSVCYAVGADGAQRRCLIQCNDSKCPFGLNCFELNGRNNQKSFICLPPS